MALLTYTTFDEIRAVLGVSATELDNDDLNQPMYDLQVILALEAVAPGIPALFTTLNSLSSGTATVPQARFIGLVSLYSAYAAAKHLLTSLPMFAVQALTDGRASFDRNTNVSIYDNVKAEVRSTLAEIGLLLRASYYATTLQPEPAAAVIRPLLTMLSTRGIDPVTNI